MTKVKVTFPPVSATEETLADLSMVISGKTSVKVTVASSASVAAVPSSSTAETVAMFV